MTSRWDVTLPWPAKELSPNARVHWSVKAKAAKDARLNAFILANMAGLHHMPIPEGRLHLWMDFYPPDKRRRDDDNVFSACKAFRDGVADALGIDDSRFVSHPLMRDEVCKRGKVVFTITGGPEHG